MYLSEQLSVFIDNLETTSFMKGYISGKLLPVIFNDSILNDFNSISHLEFSSLRVVDIPEFMKRKENKN